MRQSVALATTGEAPVDRSGWLSKIEAGKALGVSTKTIEKYVDQGRLRQELQPQINKPARAIIDPVSIEEFKAKRDAQTALAPTATSAVTMPAALPKNVGESLLEVFSELSASVKAKPKLFLTLDEAVAFSGLGKTYLKRALEWRPIGYRGAKMCRRFDLENL